MSMEIIEPPSAHRRPLPGARGSRPGTLARCKVCGDVWLLRPWNESGRGYWWRLGWWGLWRNRKALR